MARPKVGAPLECIGGPWDGERWEVEILLASQNPHAWYVDSGTRYEVCWVWDPA